MPRSPKSRYTAFASTADRSPPGWSCAASKTPAIPDALFPVWRYHPFFTNTDQPVDAGRHHPPPPRDHRNRLRRPDRRAAGPHALGTLRRELRLDPVRGDRPQPAARRRRRWPAAHTPSPAAPPCAASIVNIPARLARPQRRPVLHLPTHWPWSQGLAHAVAQHHRPQPATANDHPDHRRQGPTGAHRKSWTDQQIPPAHTPKTEDQQALESRLHQFIGGSRLNASPLNRVARYSRSLRFPELHFAHNDDPQSVTGRQPYGSVHQLSETSRPRRGRFTR